MFSSFINEHQLRLLIALLQKDYAVFGTQKKDGKIEFTILDSTEIPQIPNEKATLTMKKILWPNPIDIETTVPKKIAFFGITNCDAKAVRALLTELGRISIEPSKVLIVSTECKPDDTCFCKALNSNMVDSSDIHLQKEKGGYSVFALSKQGEKILKIAGIKAAKKALEIREIDDGKKVKLDGEEITWSIENRASFEKKWQGIANNCFACGACTAVCPLCFCTSNDYENKTDGSCKKCLRYTSCFSDSFSKITNFDYREKRVDRLYNWYHHKFVRAKSENDHFLCTGCGRCIEACPAGLNQFQILKSIVILNGEEPGDDNLEKVDAND